jgi:viroplasmin and RNaseH domain-containing protein
MYLIFLLVPCWWYVLFQGKHEGIYNSWRIYQAQVNGFSNNSYRWYESLEESQEEFPNFLADEDMAL